MPTLCGDVLAQGREYLVPGGSCIPSAGGPCAGQPLCDINLVPPPPCARCYFVKPCAAPHGPAQGWHKDENYSELPYKMDYISYNNNFSFLYFCKKSSFKNGFHLKWGLDPAVSALVASSGTEISRRIQPRTPKNSKPPSKIQI